MNTKGSYKALRNNSKAAMLAAIEVYNKPQMAYRDECFSILLVNAWELLLKAVLAKNKGRIYYSKQRGQPYRTLSIEDALAASRQFFPAEIPHEPVSRNIQMLITFRNNAIHFYNQQEFRIIIYGLAQTSIVNYRDLLLFAFNVDIAHEMTLNLLPLSFGTMPDPIEFLQKTNVKSYKNKAVAQYLREISQATKELESQHFDTSRFLTVFTVNLQSVKKVSSADIKVAVTGSGEEGSEPLIIERRVDPNISHSWRQKDLIEKVGAQLQGISFTTYTFQALVWKYNIKNKPHLCWIPATGGSPQYSPEIASLFTRLSKQEIESALNDYKDYQRISRKTRKTR